MLRCLLIVFCLNISAQSVTEYYDAAQKQPKSTTSFSNGTPNGLHTEYSIDGSVLVSGWFKQGDMDSTWTHFYTNGTAKSIESYKNGFLNGPSTYYYKNKTIAQTTNHSKGVAEGEWKLFYENGSPQATEYYVKGKKQGEWTNYYKTGGPQSKYTYSNDILNGPYQEWHAGPNTNKIKCTGMFSFGQKTGTWTTFYPSGLLLQKGHYQDSTWYLDELYALSNKKNYQCRQRKPYRIL